MFADRHGLKLYLAIWRGNFPASERRRSISKNRTNPKVLYAKGFQMEVCNYEACHFCFLSFFLQIINISV